MGQFVRNGRYPDIPESERGKIITGRHVCVSSEPPEYSKIGKPKDFSMRFFARCFLFGCVKAAAACFDSRWAGWTELNRKQCSITWGVMELEPDHRGRRAEVLYITSNTISY